MTQELLNPGVSEMRPVLLQSPENVCVYCVFVEAVTVTVVGAMSVFGVPEIVGIPLINREKSLVVFVPPLLLMTIEATLRTAGGIVGAMSL